MCFISFPIIFSNIHFTDVLTFTCIQGFSVGGLLAFFHLKGSSTFKRIGSYFIYLGFILFVLFILSFLKVVPMFLNFRFYVDCITSGIIALILIYPNLNFNKYILGNYFLVGFGKISYGIYLFHNFIPVFWNAVIKLLEKKGFSIPFTSYQVGLYNQSWVFYLQCFIILYIIAFLSFNFYEKPFVRLKDKLAKSV